MERFSLQKGAFTKQCVHVCFVLFFKPFVCFQLVQNLNWNVLAGAVKHWSLIFRILFLWPYFIQYWGKKGLPRWKILQLPTGKRKVTVCTNEKTTLGVILPNVGWLHIVMKFWHCLACQQKAILLADFASSDEGPALSGLSCQQKSILLADFASSDEGPAMSGSSS